MLFDVQAALAEILADAPATIATAATKAPRVANVATVAAPQPFEKTPAALPFTPPPSAPAPSRQTGETYPHGQALNGWPKTWTGKIVSLDEWRALSDWDKHGSKGKLWNGITHQWKPDGVIGFAKQYAPACAGAGWGE